MNIVVPLVRDLSPPAPGDEVLSFSVTPSGDVLTMWASPEGRALLTGYEEHGIGMFPQTSPPRPVDVRVVRDTPYTREETRVLSVTTSFPTAHAMPGGAILVVGARAAWSPEAPEHNGHVYDADGRLVRSACLGDGIEHALTTAKGRIWVGYFDEGVFGNFGWDGPGPRPIGAPGLNLFDEQLNLVLSNDAVNIVSCYALGGQGERALECAYTGWEIGLFDPDGAVVSYANRVVDGARAIAQEDDVVVLVGGYGGNRDRVVVGRLVELPTGTRELRSLGVGRVALPDGTWDVNDVVGRDSALHVRSGTRWHRIAVRDVLAALGAARP